MLHQRYHIRSCAIEYMINEHVAIQFHTIFSSPSHGLSEQRCPGNRSYRNHNQRPRSAFRHLKINGARGDIPSSFLASWCLMNQMSEFKGLKQMMNFPRPACFFVKPFLDLNHNGDCLCDVEPFRSLILVSTCWFSTYPEMLQESRSKILTQ